MTNLFLNIGFGVLLLLPVLRFTDQLDKFNCALVIATILCLRAIYKGSLKIRDKWLIGVLACLPFSIYLGYYTDFKAITAILMFTCMFAGLSREKAENSLNFVVLCGFIMAVYSILQFLGFESLFDVNLRNQATLYTPSYYMAGTLNHPTFLGAFLAMIVPLALKTKKWIYAVVIAIAVLLTRSDMAIGSMVCSLVAIPFFKTPKRFINGCLIALCLAMILALNFNAIKPKIGDSGRFRYWEQILDTMQRGIQIRNAETGKEMFKKYNLFGLGAGSYEKLFPLKIIRENFNTCHNEYLQVYVEFGIVTLVFFSLFLFFSLKNGYDVYTKSAILCICLNAIGLFVWQLGATAFLSVYLLCLNKKD